MQGVIAALLVGVPLVLLSAAAREANGEQAAYTVQRADATGRALLDADPTAWSDAESVEWGSEPYPTRFRALWDRRGLFVRFDAVDPSPWHTMTERDDHLWNEEVVEIFIDPDGDGRNYAEIEINPANVVCDLLIHEAAPEFRSEIEWDFAGLVTAVLPLRDGRGEPVGWTATAFLPWEGFAALPEIESGSLPPRAGTSWSFNVFRIKRPWGPDEPARDVVFAPWSPTSGPSFHEPAVFRELRFVE